MTPARDATTAVHALILKALRQGDMTHHEIAEHAGLHHSQIHKRLPELEALGAIERTEQRRVGPARRYCTVWRIRS